MTRYYHESTKENLIAIAESIESAIANLSIQIEGTEEISEQEFSNLEVHINDLYSKLRELNEQIYGLN